MNLRHIIGMQKEWSLQTFGPGRRTEGICIHIEKELSEIRAAPTDVEEWCDVVILALDGAWRAGFTPEQITEALINKQLKNIRRNWPTGIQPENQPIEHTKEPQ